jgi:hypothetical protein
VLGKADAQELAGHGEAHGPLVAYIGNPARDEIHLLVGTRKVVLRDRALVSKLVRAAR